MKKSIKGKYLILAGITLFIFGRLISYLFPNDIITLTFAVCAEISFFIFIGIGIIAVIREKREKKITEKSDNAVAAESHTITQPTKENKQSKLDIVLKLSIILGILVFSTSMFYQFVYKPYTKEVQLKNCLSQSESNFSRKQSEIDKKIQEAENERVEKNRDYEKFLKENSEPEKPKLPTWGEWYNKEWRSKHSEYSSWEDERDSFLKPVKDLETKISNLKKDLAIILEEKKKEDNICGSKYR